MNFPDFKKEKLADQNVRLEIERSRHGFYFLCYFFSFILKVFINLKLDVPLVNCLLFDIHILNVVGVNPFLRIFGLFDNV